MHMIAHYLSQSEIKMNFIASLLLKHFIFHPSVFNLITYWWNATTKIVFNATRFLQYVQIL